MNTHVVNTCSDYLAQDHRSTFLIPIQDRNTQNTLGIATWYRQPVQIVQKGFSLIPNECIHKKYIIILVLGFLVALFNDQ
jgi:hypothetical protein